MFRHTPLLPDDGFHAATYFFFHYVAAADVAMLPPITLVDITCIITPLLRYYYIRHAIFDISMPCCAFHADFRCCRFHYFFFFASGTCVYAMPLFLLFACHCLFRC